MTNCSEAARPFALDELEQLAPPPSQDPVRAAAAIVEAAERESATLRQRAVADGYAEGVRPRTGGDGRHAGAGDRGAAAPR